MNYSWWIFQAKQIVSEAGIPWLIEQMNVSDETLVTAVQYMLQMILNSLCGLNLTDLKDTETKKSKTDPQLKEGNATVQT